MNEVKAPKDYKHYPIERNNMKTRDGEKIEGWGIDGHGRPYVHLNDGYGYGGNSSFYSNIYWDGPPEKFQTLWEKYKIVL